MFMCLLSECNSCSRSRGSERNKTDIWLNLFAHTQTFCGVEYTTRYERLQSVVTASWWCIDRQMQPGTARLIMAVSRSDKPFNVSQSSTARQTCTHPLNSTSVSLAWKKNPITENLGCNTQDSRSHSCFEVAPLQCLKETPKVKI